MTSLAIIFVLALSQQPAAQGAVGQQPPVIRRGTVAVEVDVTARDKEGRFVADLTADDFELLEDGKPQTIETVYLVDGGRPAGGAPALPVNAGVERVTGGRRVFVWLFDRDHLSPGSFNLAHTAVRSFLADGFRNTDVGGVIVSGSPKGRLTSDRDALLADLDQAKPGGASRSRQMELRTWPRFLNEDEAVRVARRERQAVEVALRRAVADEPQLCLKFDCEGSVIEKAQLIAASARAGAAGTRNALDGVLSTLGRLPGRKALVFITEGYVVEGLGSELQRVIGAAASAGVTIYAIDARGLDRRSMGDVTQTREVDSLDVAQAERGLSAAEDIPNALAVDTGGFAIRNTNQIRRGLDEIADDTGTYYVLGYSPVNRALDGSFRRIAVRVKRAGVSVRARRGYVAAPAAAAPLVPAARTRAEAGGGVPPEISNTTAAPEPPAAAPLPGNTADASPAPPPPRPKSIDRAAELAGAPPAAAGGERLVPEGGDKDAALGWTRYSKGDLEGARDAFAAAAARPGAPPWVRYALGMAEFGLGRYAEAARTWEPVREAAPQFETVYLDLADAYLQLGDLGKAVAILRTAQERWPKDAEVHNALGVIQTRRGALDDAIASFTQAVATAPADETGHFNLARAYEMRYLRSRRFKYTSAKAASDDDRSRAIEHYRRCVEIGGSLEASARESLRRLQWQG